MVCIQQVSLSIARKKRDEYLEKLTNGINPNEIKKEAIKLEKLESNKEFSKVALEWMDKLKSQLSQDYHGRLISALERDIFPYLKGKNIDEIEPLEFLKVIQKIEERGAVESAHRIFSLCAQIWKFAVATQRAKHNIAADIDKKYALQKPQEKNYPTITNPDEIDVLLKAIESYRGDFSTRHALRFSILVGQRPGNIREAEWSEIDFENAIWSIPGHKMKCSTSDKKKREPHIVPLSKQAISVLRDVEPYSRGSIYIFPSPQTKLRPISNNTVNIAIKRLGFGEQLVAHGFRHMFSTICHEHIEAHGVHTLAIEAAIAHKDSNSIRGTYNKAKYVKERTQLMQWWANWLDNLRKNH